MNRSIWLSIYLQVALNLHSAALIDTTSKLINHEVSLHRGAHNSGDHIVRDDAAGDILANSADSLSIPKGYDVGGQLNCSILRL